ncbi:hypothetical protein RRG08_019996 [Elysia crispata]|uniref:Uncharacterized protein n=1 Tax=Elysia crispata TaxID=231223 RepID=A0AAE1BB72_9GAST|nr:hypothetical protein RRG08_019996 [Elysia crispata]
MRIVLGFEMPVHPGNNSSLSEAVSKGNRHKQREATEKELALISTPQPLAVRTNSTQLNLPPAREIRHEN